MQVYFSRDTNRIFHRLKPVNAAQKSDFLNIPPCKGILYAIHYSISQEQFTYVVIYKGQTMIDSNTVLLGQTIAYTFYVLAIMLLMGWFAYNVTKGGKKNKIKPAIFYSFTGFLIVLGVSLHIITYNTIPWSPLDLNRSEIKADKIFSITVANHKFQLPSEKLMIKNHEKVLFNVTSNDLTYGFGLFRQDNSMVFQMQVIPGHVNDILWRFDKPGIYSIRSTEYSGPKGLDMMIKDAVQVD
jgi:cytochrome c oxidase subunit 2